MFFVLRRCSLFVACCLMFVVGCALSNVCCSLFDVGCVLFVVCRLQFVVRVALLFVQSFCCVYLIRLFIVCWWFVVCLFVLV